MGSGKCAKAASGGGSGAARTGRKPYTCRKCKAHNLQKTVSRHKRNCPFKNCICEKCRCIDAERNTVSKQIQNYRRHMCEDQQQAVVLSAGQAVRTRKAAAHVRGQGPSCRRCRNHGNVNISWKGHKKICPFQSCMCDECKLIYARRLYEKRLRDLQLGAFGEPSKECPQAPASATALLTATATAVTALSASGCGSTANAARNPNTSAGGAKAKRDRSRVGKSGKADQQSPPNWPPRVTGGGGGTSTNHSVSQLIGGRLTPAPGLGLGLGVGRVPVPVSPVGLGVCMEVGRGVGVGVGGGDSACSGFFCGGLSDNSFPFAGVKQSSPFALDYSPGLGLLAGHHSRASCGGGGGALSSTALFGLNPLPPPFPFAVQAPCWSSVVSDSSCAGLEATMSSTGLPVWSRGLLGGSAGLYMQQQRSAPPLTSLFESTTGGTMLGALNGCYWQPGVGVSDLSPRLGWGQSLSATASEPPSVPLLRAALKQEHCLFPALEAHVRSPQEQPPNLVAAANLNLKPNQNLSTSSTALPCISELRPAFTLHWPGADTCNAFAMCPSQACQPAAVQRQIGTSAPGVGVGAGTGLGLGLVSSASGVDAFALGGYLSLPASACISSISPSTLPLATSRFNNGSSSPAHSAVVPGGGCSAAVALLGGGSTVPLPPGSRLFAGAASGFSTAATLPFDGFDLQNIA